MNNRMEEFIYFFKFSSSVCIGLYLIGNILHLEYKILEEAEVVAAGTTSLTDIHSLPAASQTSYPNFTWLKYWYIAHYALPPPHTHTQNQRCWTTRIDCILHEGNHRLLPTKEERSLPVNSCGVAIQHCQSHVKRLLSHPPPAQGHSGNWTGSGNHCDCSYMFQAQWTHIYTEKAKSDSHFRTVKRPMLDPLSSNFLF